MKIKVDIFSGFLGAGKTTFTIPIEDISKLSSALKEEDLFTRGIVKKVLIKIKNNILR